MVLWVDYHHSDLYKYNINNMEPIRIPCKGMGGFGIFLDGDQVETLLNGMSPTYFEYISKSNTKTIITRTLIPSLKQFMKEKNLGCKLLCSEYDFKDEVDGLVNAKTIMNIDWFPGYNIEKVAPPEISEVEPVDTTTDYQVGFYVAIDSDNKKVFRFKTEDNRQSKTLETHYFFCVFMNLLTPVNNELIKECKTDFIKPLISQLKKCSSAYYCHRDIKPANIMMQKKEGNTYKATFIDFGMLKKAREAEFGDGTGEFFSPWYAASSRHKTYIDSPSNTEYTIFGKLPSQGQQNLRWFDIFRIYSFYTFFNSEFYKNSSRNVSVADLNKFVILNDWYALGVSIHEIFGLPSIVIDLDSNEQFISEIITEIVGIKKMVNRNNIWTEKIATLSNDQKGILVPHLEKIINEYNLLARESGFEVGTCGADDKDTELTPWKKEIIKAFLYFFNRNIVFKSPITSPIVTNPSS